MGRFDKATIMFGAVGLGCAVLVAPGLMPGSNCGGNSSAWNVCKQCVLEMRAGVGYANGKFDVRNLPAEARSEIARISRNHWIADAKILVRTNYELGSNPKQILVVCDLPFDNVPQPAVWNFYRRNPAHAVGYSDGTAGLITREQFKKVDLTGFVDGLTINSTNSATVQAGIGL